MSSKTKVLTPDDIAHDSQEFRCRAALKILDVPENVIYSLSGPLLFQMAHLCAVIDEPMHWRDALRWMHDHKGEILEHARVTMGEKYQQAQSAASSSNGTANGDHVGASREGQSLRMGDDGVPMERTQNPAGGN